MKQRKTLRQKKEIFVEVTTIAHNLAKDLSYAKCSPNGMEVICDFVQKTSEAKSKISKLVKGCNFGKKRQIFISRFIEILEEASGQNKNGWNTAKDGEIPTEDKVVIKIKRPYDQVFGTRSVAEHLSKKDEQPHGIDPVLKRHYPGMNETSIVQKKFVNPFIKRSYESLCDIVDKV